MSNFQPSLKSNLKCLLAITPTLGLLACGGAVSDSPGASSLTPSAVAGAPTAISLPPVGQAGEDEAVVHGRAIYTVGLDQSIAWLDFLERLWMPRAYAAGGATTVTYTNAASTGFTINVSGFAPGSFSGNTLSLGNVAVSSLFDNNLKVCGANGTTKCTQGVIRVYTTGTVAGFVNTADGYGAPVYTGTLNPANAVGIGAANSVPVQTLSIPSIQHTATILNFPNPSYAVSADFANAGAGAYAMTYVVEYALLP